MSDQIKCPFCGYYQKEDFAKIDYSGESFEVRCESCDVGFLCEASINFTCFPEGIWIVGQDNFCVKEITDEVLKKIKTSNELYRYKPNGDLFIYSFFKMNKKFIINGIEGKEGDYIQGVCSIGQTKQKITKELLSFISKQYFEEYYEKIGD